MPLKPSDFMVITDTKGDLKYIQGPNGMSIPVDLGNSRYQDFLLVDTNKHLCARQVIPEPVVSTKPTLEARIAALEATAAKNTASITAIATKIGTVIETAIKTG
jgi:hypothetical protein